MENKFKVVSKYKPTGDQPQAIEKIAEGFQEGLKFQTLLGVSPLKKRFSGKEHKGAGKFVPCPPYPTAADRRFLHKPKLCPVKPGVCFLSFFS